MEKKERKTKSAYQKKKTATKVHKGPSANQVQVSMLARSNGKERKKNQVSVSKKTATRLSCGCTLPHVYP
jgi:hypothetical protein